MCAEVLGRSLFFFGGGGGGGRQVNCVCAEVLGRSALWVGTVFLWGGGGGLSVLKSKKCFVGLFVFWLCFFLGGGGGHCVC